MTRAQKELAAVPAARAAGVRTPAIVVADDSCDVVPVPYAVYERVHAESLEAIGADAEEAAEVWRELGHTSLEDFLVAFWEGFFLDGRDPNNLLTMLDTWWNGDVGRTPGFASTEEALASIRAVGHMSTAELRVIPGVWGHFAGGGANPVDTAFIDGLVAELLAQPSGI